jgi:hypothetical protein
MIGTNVGNKLFVALFSKIILHFFERFAGGLCQRLEPPATFGATKPPKAWLLDPYQFPCHGYLGRSTPMSARMLSWDESEQVRH